jgi:triosephosphate isomerase (TIM)
MRRYLIAGNWKMNKTAVEGQTLVAEIVKTVGTVSKVDIVVCPPYTGIQLAAAGLQGSSVKLGAQNCHTEASGAYTGEVSAGMLRASGCDYVILGHSERRQYFAESDAFINKKVHASLKNGIVPILCVGELLAEREANKTLEVVKTQTVGGLAGVSAADAAKIVIAYEPVWAIGTGKVATTAQAQEVHAFIRGLLTELFGAAIAQQMRILYGGSMKPANAPELLAQPDVDGGLIGGASLEAKSFAELVTAAVAA